MAPGGFIWVLAMTSNEEEIFSLYDFTMSDEEFSRLDACAKFPSDRRDEFRDLLNSAFGHFRFQSELYRRTSTGPEASNKCKRFASTAVELTKLLDDWETSARLADMAIADGSFPEIAGLGDGERAIAELRRLLIGASQWARFAGTQTSYGKDYYRAAVRAKGDPNDRILVGALLDFWCHDLQLALKNGIYEAKPGARSSAAPLTRFVSEALKIVGRERLLEAVRKEIDRTRDLMNKNKTRTGHWRVLDTSYGSPNVSDD